MIKSSRTPVGIYHNLCKQFGIAPVIQPHTTLNEKFNVLPGIVPSDMGDLKTQYLAIGNGGLSAGDVTSNTNNAQVNVTPISPIRRKTQANALYSHIPFVLRRVGEDLAPVERARYRMRVLEQHNGEQFVAYYLRAIPDFDQSPQTELISYQDGERSVTAYTPNASTLFPAHPVSTGTQEGLRSEITVQLRIRFELTEEDVAEVVNAVTTIYGVAGYGMISEIGLVSGADATIEIDVDGNANTPFVEAVGAQLVGSMTVGRFIELGEVAGVTDILVGGSDALTL